MTIYLVYKQFNLYILVMNTDKNPENIRISKRLETLLDQLESVTIFDKENCEHTSKYNENKSEKLKPE